MSEHECEELIEKGHKIFHSPLWNGWSLKLIHPNHKEAAKAGVNLPTMHTVIKYCPYCGMELK